MPRVLSTGQLNGVVPACANGSRDRTASDRLCLDDAFETQISFRARHLSMKSLGIALKSRSCEYRFLSTTAAQAILGCTRSENSEDVLHGLCRKLRGWRHEFLVPDRDSGPARPGPASPRPNASPATRQRITCTAHLAWRTTWVAVDPRNRSCMPGLWLAITMQSGSFFRPNPERRVRHAP